MEPADAKQLLALTPAKSTFYEIHKAIQEPFSCGSKNHKSDSPNYG